MSTRKACDLCYRKRIKCDAGLPRCSQCVLHESPCTHEAASRPKKRRKAVAAQASLKNTPQATVGHPAQHLVSDAELALLDPALPIEDELRGSFSQASDTSSHRILDLPPERVVRQAVDTYLAGINQVFPLHDASSLTGIVDKWYTSVSHRTCENWAAINTVMALAQYHAAALEPVPEPWALDTCLSNAQSVLTKIVMGDLSLLNVQIVLALVMLFQGSAELRPALVLVSTALRLCHSLGLHRKDHYVGLSPNEALQRSRVFWIAYILDRDLALRKRQAPIQQDADMDLDYPSQPMGGAHSSFDVFLAHIELAHIQGLTYTSLLSVGAASMAPEDVAQATQTTRMLLLDWKSRIPSSLSGKMLSQDRQTVMPRIFCTLYSRAFNCLGILSRVHSMDYEWIESFLSHARSVGLGFPSTPPPLPPGWDALIRECRSFMPLFLSIERKDASFVWSNLCPFVSGLLCLSANSFLEPRGTHYEEDELIKTGAVAFMGSIAQELKNVNLNKALKAYDEFSWYLCQSNGGVERLFLPEDAGQV